MLIRTHINTITNLIIIIMRSSGFAEQSSHVVAATTSFVFGLGFAANAFVFAFAGGVSLSLRTSLRRGAAGAATAFAPRFMATVKKTAPDA
jgi:Na+-translocating ferredoxin:NAD+ oxidoreductase RnfE subunit